MSTPQPPGIPETPQTPVPPPPGAAQPGASVPPIAAPAEPVAEEDRRSTWQPGLYLKIGLLLLAVAYSIAFVVENSTQIKIHFVFGTARVRLVWEILLLLGVGIVGGILLSQLYRHRRRTQLAKKSGEARHSRSHFGRRDKAVGKSR